MVDGNQAGPNTAFGLGLIDITQVNAVDAYTKLPLDNSAKLRIYGGGWVEVVPRPSCDASSSPPSAHRPPRPCDCPGSRTSAYSSAD